MNWKKDCKYTQVCLQVFHFCSRYHLKWCLLHHLAKTAIACAVYENTVCIWQTSSHHFQHSAGWYWSCLVQELRLVNCACQCAHHSLLWHAGSLVKCVRQPRTLPSGVPVHRWQNWCVQCSVDRNTDIWCILGCALGLIFLWICIDGAWLFPCTGISWSWSFNIVLSQNLNSSGFCVEQCSGGWLFWECTPT